MADVKIIDIGGEQWNIKDQESREKIAEIEKNISAQDLPNVQITLKNGYTCKTIRITDCYKAGKIFFGCILIENLSGKGIGGVSGISIASTNLRPKGYTTFIGRDTKAPGTVRFCLRPNGILGLEECNGIKDGYNVILGEVIFAES